MPSSPAARTAWRFAVNPPSIPGLGTTGGFEFYIQNRGSGDPRATDAALQAFLAKARQRPELQGVSTTFRANSQQLFVDLDRNKAEVLGVHVGDVFQTMQAFFGSQIAGQFSQFSRVWFVILQADADYRARPEDFHKVYVRSANGANIPLSALITTRYVASPKLMTRFNGFPAVKVTGNPAPGFSSGQAIRVMEEVRERNAAGRFRLRLGRPGAAGEGVGQHLVVGLHLRPDHRVPAARRAVREVDAADRGGAHRAVRGARRAAPHLGCSGWRTTSTSRSAW